MGITNGNESQVGYYVGLMVRCVVQTLQCHLLTELCIAIVVFRDPGVHYIALGSNV